jgi:copper resistance protein C
VHHRNSLRICALAVLILTLAIQPATGHAVLVESSPAANGSVHGPNVSFRLRFNSRIDAGRSRLTLMQPDGSTQTLKIPDQAAPDTLTAEASALKSGSYNLRWQVLATDGHITRGEIPFTVTGS